MALTHHGPYAPKPLRIVTLLTWGLTMAPTYYYYLPLLTTYHYSLLTYHYSPLLTTTYHYLPGALRQMLEAPLFPETLQLDDGERGLAGS